MTATEAQIREVLKTYGRLRKDALTVGLEDDLYQAGMSSQSSVNVMMGLERAFDVEFPDEMLKHSVFGSIASLQAAILTLQGG